MPCKCRGPRYQLCIMLCLDCYSGKTEPRYLLPNYDKKESTSNMKLIIVCIFIIVDYNNYYKKYSPSGCSKPL